MENQLKAALQLITEKCKEPNWHHMMQSKSLSKRIGSIQSMVFQYVDSETINYRKTQIAKQKPDRYRADEFRVVELSSREKADSIANLKWLIRDIEACISHLEE